MELTQIEERNNTLNKDNAKLLQRWLDAKQAEVNKMNEANEFYEDMKSRKQTDSTGGDGDVSSGKEESKTGSDASTTTDGTPSPAQKDVSQTPNG